MARTKGMAPVTGLYYNGTRLWVRTVPAPLSGTQARLSTGTSDVKRANAIKGMVDTFAKNESQYPWLERAVAGEVTLDRLFTHHAAGTLHVLKEQLAAVAAADADMDLDPIAEKWLTEYVARQSIADDTKGDYRRQIRALIPAGVRFPASRFTADTLSEVLDALRGARHDAEAPLSNTTKRHHVAAWRLFYNYARSRVTNLPNPFDDDKWIPDHGSPRSTTWDFETVTKVLDRMSGEDRVAMSLVFGSGIELGALLSMRREHIGTMRPKIEDDERTIVAPGSK
ncbi:MAG: hypothetical protein ACREPM_10290, partial [Gemmatimonadaceae bacterium]